MSEFELSMPENFSGDIDVAASEAVSHTAAIEPQEAAVGADSLTDLPAAHIFALGGLAAISAVGAILNRSSRQNRR